LKKKAVSIIGTRPEIVKMYPLIFNLDKIFDHKVIFSGQHFSKNMAFEIFEDLKLRKEDISIKIKNRENFLLEFSKKLINILNKINPNYVDNFGNAYEYKC
jgi:UDP-N-acetylglucosamine 2-epimerase